MRIASALISGLVSFVSCHAQHVNVISKVVDVQVIFIAYHNKGINSQDDKLWLGLCVVHQIQVH